jgi:hypothetical protein
VKPVKWRCEMCDSRMEHCHHKPWSEWSAGAKVGVIAAGVVCVPGLFALFGAVTMWLWNALMPEIFKLPAIGLWQAIGLLLLSHILFRGCGMGRAGRGHWKRHQVWKHMREDEAASGERQ